MQIWLPALLLGLEGAMILTAILAAWLKFGRADLPARTLLAVPFYVLWKIPLYVAYAIRPQTPMGADRARRDLKALSWPSIVAIASSRPRLYHHSTSLRES